MGCWRVSGSARSEWHPRTLSVSAIVARGKIAARIRHGLQTRHAVSDRAVLPQSSAAEIARRDSAHHATGKGATDDASDEIFPRAASIEGALNPTQLSKIRPDGPPVRRHLNVTKSSRKGQRAVSLETRDSVNPLIQRLFKNLPNCRTQFVAYPSVLLKSSNTDGTGL